MAGTPNTVIGARMVSNITSVDRVRNVSPVVLMLQSNRKNLMTYLQGLGIEGTDNYEFEWIKDEIIPNRGLTAASAASAASGTTGTLDLGTGEVYVRVDEQLYFPSTGEICRVSATPAAMSAVGVVRNVPGGATATIASGALWINIGDSRAAGTRLYTTAGSDSLQALSTTNSFETNYTQTFEEPFGLTRREAKSKNYSGKDEAQGKTKALLQHCEKIEHAFFYGKKHEGSNDRTETGGAISWIPSGNTETIATLTPEEFDDFVNRITRYDEDGGKRVLFCSRMVAVRISQWAYENNRIHSEGKTITHGVHVDNILTAGGQKVGIVTCHALEGVPGAAMADAQGHDGTGLLLNMTGKKKVVFGGDDMKYAEGLQYNDQIGDKTNAYLSDVGYKPGDSRKDGLILGVTG